jgi:hypothetical protein
VQFEQKVEGLKMLRTLYQGGLQGRPDHLAVAQWNAGQRSGSVEVLADGHTHASSPQLVN